LQLAAEGTHDDEIYNNEQEISEITSQISSIRENIKSLEEEQAFIYKKITERSK
jgi:uncharacterized protein (DUF3084 family)